MPFSGLLEREVGATVDEYLRGLRTAFPQGTQDGAGRYTAHEADTTLIVAITPLPTRVVGGFEFPRLQVLLSFSGGDEASQRALLEHMDRMMLRGGG